MLRFFYAPNTCSLAAQIALEDAALEYELVSVQLRKDAQREPAFLAINPKGRVPALVTEQGVLTETLAILSFIALSAPHARLAPSDPFAYARALSFNSYLCSTVHIAHAHGRRGLRWADDPAAISEMKRKVPETMAACFALIERELFVGPWVLGDTYSICDPYLFTIAGWLEGDGVDPARFPKVHEHTERMAERASVKRALEREAAG